MACQDIERVKYLFIGDLNIVVSLHIVKFLVATVA